MFCTKNHSKVGETLDLRSSHDNRRASTSSEVLAKGVYVGQRLGLVS